MNINELLKSATQKLKTKSTSPSLDAEVLLAFVLKKTKEFVLIHSGKSVTAKQMLIFNRLVRKRAAGWPVAYLTHQKEFFGLSFYMDKNVLIPRPDTETLVELVLKSTIDSRFQTPDSRPLSILDIGTGSGAIIISLAKNLPTGQFFASDISAPALKVAKQNAKTHQVKIAFKHGDLLVPWKKQQFDIIAANLPYLARETDPSTEFEPKLALIAKKSGLALYEKLFTQLSSSYLFPPPSSLFLEIGSDQSAKIKNLAKQYLPDYRTDILKDLSGRVRFASLARDPN